MIKKQKNLKNLLILLVIAILLVFFLIYIYRIPSESLDAYLTVGDHLGFNINASALYFGTIPPQGIGGKTIFIENNKCNVCVVKIKAEGDFKDWIEVSENKFLLRKDETKEVNVSVIVPKNAKFGSYNSTLTIYFRRKLF